MPETYDSTKDTKAHIEEVRNKIAVFVTKLLERSIAHDASKLEDPEKETFDRVTPELAGLTYGSEAYSEALEDMDVALKHHYAHNSHHPEHYEDGALGMDLVDIIEMFCDWKAATMRHDDGDFKKSIQINKDRFQFGEVLTAIFENTRQRLDW